MDETARDLIRRARRGERLAWDTLLAGYQLRLFGFARRLLGNQEDAMDVVQETFISSIRNISSLRDDERFAGWLFAIARQHCLQCLRKRGRAIVTTVEELPDVPDSAEGAEELSFRKNQGALIEKEIAMLPEPQKSVVLLHYFLELPLSEIAEIMQSPLGTVKSRLHFAREALRHTLSGVRR